MNRRHLLATAALGLSLAFGGAAQAQDKTKACFVYVGPIGDGGWTFQHHAPWPSRRPMATRWKSPGRKTCPRARIPSAC